MPKRVVVCLHVYCVSGIGVVVDADSWHPKNGMERGTVEPLLLLGCKTGLDMGHILDFLISVVKSQFFCWVNHQVAGKNSK